MIGAAARRPAVVFAGALAVLLAGAVAAARVPLVTTAAVDASHLAIVATWPGSSPEMVETYLTSPIERAVQTVRGVANVNSISTDDVAMLSVELAARADAQLTRLAIVERLELLGREFPAGVHPPQVSPDAPQGLNQSPLMSLTISGPFTPGALQRLCDDRVTPRLAQVAGVAQVQGSGGADAGIAVRYDAARLRQLGVSPEGLAQAVSAARVSAALGELSDGRTVQEVVLRDAPEDIEGLARLPVVGPAGRVYTVGELATIRADEDTRGQFYRVNGEPALSVDVWRHPDADARQTAAAVRAEVKALSQHMPPGVRLRITDDESQGLSRILRDIAARVGVACVTLLVLLVLWFRHWRTVAVVAGAAVVALAATVLTLSALHIPVTISTLALLGMGLGMLLQPAIVMMHYVACAPCTDDEPAATVCRVAPALMGSMLVTSMMVLSCLLLPREARAAQLPSMQAVAVAHAWGTMSAVLVVPALVIRADVQSPRWQCLTRWYAAMMVRALRWRQALPALVLISLAGAVWMLVLQERPAPQDRWAQRRTTLAVTLTFPRGSDPGTLDRVMRDLERLVVGHPGVAQVRTQSTGPTRARLSVTFTSDAEETAVPAALQDALTQRATRVGGAQVAVVGDGRGFSSGTGGGRPATFRLQVTGYSYDGVRRLTNDLTTRLARIPRVQGVRVSSGAVYDAMDRGAQVQLEPDRGALSRYGLTAAHFAQAVAREVRGPVGGQRLAIGADERSLTVKAAGVDHQTLDAMQDVVIPNGTGAPVRMRDVATVATREVLEAVVREDQHYVREVAFDVRGPATVARRIHAAVLRSLHAPVGYAIRDLSGGRFAVLDDRPSAFWAACSLGLALIVLALAMVFDSVWVALMAIAPLPLALAGMILANGRAGGAFPRDASLGGMLVVGFAVQQALPFLSAVCGQRRRGPDPAAILLHIARDRAPMLVTSALAACASLAPLCVGNPATSQIAASARAVAGGVIAATMGALLVVPSLVLWGRRPAGRAAMAAGRVGWPRTEGCRALAAASTASAVDW